MKPGDAVQVLRIVFYGSPAVWMSGYTFVEARSNDIYLLRIENGALAGCCVLYPAASVRPAPAVS